MESRLPRDVSESDAEDEITSTGETNSAASSASTSTTESDETSLNGKLFAQTDEHLMFQPVGESVDFPPYFFSSGCSGANAALSWTCYITPRGPEKAICALGVEGLGTVCGTLWELGL